METDKARMLGRLIGLIMLPFLFWWGWVYIENKAKDLHDNAQIVYGTVLERNSCNDYVYRGSSRRNRNNRRCSYADYEIIFQYNVNQKIFKGRGTFRKEASQAKYKVGDTVQIIYSSRNPENSQLK